MKQFYLKFYTLLLCLVIGGGNSFADSFTKVTSAPSDWSGEYLIVYEVSETEGLSWNGLDAGQNGVKQTINEGKINVESPVTVTISALLGNNYSIKVNGGDNDGKFISSGTSAPTYSNGLKFISSAHNIKLAFNDDSSVQITQTISGNTDASKNGTVYLIYNGNSGANNERFRFYKETNYGAGNYKTPVLYKKDAGAGISVESVSISSSTASVNIGETLTLSATVLPSNADNKTVTWSSSDTNVATVSSKGVVSGVSVGKATITAKTVDGNYTASCEVTVSAIDVTEVSLDKTSEELQVGETLNLTATVMPANATNKNVTWNSNNEDVATVLDGVVTAVSEGTAIITVKTVNGEKIASCEITVTKPKTTGTVYKKVTSNLSDWSGSYLFVYEDETVALDGSLNSGIDKASNTVEVTISNGTIYGTSSIDAAIIKVEAVEGGYALKTADGTYIGISSYGNGLKCHATTPYVNQFNYNSEKVRIEVTQTFSSGTMYLCFNSNNSDKRFRYYKEHSQKIIQLYKLEEEPTYTLASLTLKAHNSNGYYATFSSDKVAFFPEDYVVSAVGVDNDELYTFSNDEAFDGDVVEINEKEVTGFYVPAKTGVLIYSDDSNVNYYTVEGVTPGKDDVEAVNMLHPASETMTGNYQFYKLAYDDYANEKDLGFYWGAENGGIFTCKAGTAYLAVPTGSNVKSFVFADDATVIKSVAVPTLDDNAPVYNMAGQRVSANTKGIVFQNGKKYFNK